MSGQTHSRLGDTSPIRLFPPHPLRAVSKGDQLNSSSSSHCKLEILPNSEFSMSALCRGLLTHKGLSGISGPSIKTVAHDMWKTFP